MVYPMSGTAPRPNAEMPPAIKDLYVEASDIFSRSPRAAAALLRLAIQLLCRELGEKGANINDDIQSLVNKGLSPVVQQSLDAVRVIGNEAVHPGTIDTDDPEVVEVLFELLNVIVEDRIATPKKVTGIYQRLPADKLAAIKNRK